MPTTSSSNRNIASIKSSSVENTFRRWIRLKNNILWQTSPCTTLILALGRQTLIWMVVILLSSLTTMTKTQTLPPHDSRQPTAQRLPHSHPFTHHIKRSSSCNNSSGNSSGNRSSSGWGFLPPLQHTQSQPPEPLEEEEPACIAWISLFTTQKAFMQTLINTNCHSIPPTPWKHHTQDIHITVWSIGLVGMSMAVAMTTLLSMPHQHQHLLINISFTGIAPHLLLELTIGQ